ncbi:hypothetical protein L345_12932 [Ophiophagus hannah]|nr:hypothetical protein L345_12932 [Ophiophagus hannah]
MVSVCLY